MCGKRYGIAAILSAIFLLTVPGMAAAQAASIAFVDETGTPVDTIRESDVARLRVVSLADNTQSSTAETLWVELATLYFGDSESLMLTETGADTGIFEGSIQLAGPWTGFGPDVLDTANSGPPDYLPEQVTATYSGAGISAVATTVASQVDLVDGFGQVVSTYPEGDSARVRVLDGNRNDPGLIDFFIVVFDASGGDQEGVTATETGFDTGVFVGSVPLGPGSLPDDGQLDAVAGDTITVQHANYNDPGVTAAAATITGSATWFIDEAGALASSYMESTRAIVRVRDSGANLSQGLIDTATVELATELSGDSETLTLTETDWDTGVFEGSIALSLAPTSPANGVLETTQAAGPPHQWETLNASHLDGLSQTSQATATTFGSRTEFLDAFGNPVTSYATGSTAYVRVEDQNHNQIGAFDTVEVTVSSLTTGDSETLTLWETGKSTGIFEGSIGLEDDDVAEPSDGLVQVQPGEQVEAVHTDFLGLTQTSATAQISEISIELVDAAGVPSDVVVESDWAHVRLVSPYDNLDSSAAETVTVNVTTLYFGDDETLWLTETGADTGVFEGSVRLAGPWTGSGPGFLDTANSGAPEYLPEVITAFYTFGSTTVSAVARTASSRVDLVDGFGQAVSTYPEGALARARVFDVNRNDPGLIDSFIVVFEASGGDQEGVTVTETGFDTSVYVGSVPLGPGSGLDDGQLDAVAGDTITLLHANYNDPGVTSATASITGSATWFIDGTGQLASSYMESSEAAVRVADDLANSNPGAVETTTVALSTELSGDSETLTLTETGPDTGVFEGTIPLSLAPTSPANGVLETTQAAGPPHEWETLYASHMDGLGQTSQATATTFGSRTEFLDAFGNLVSSYATGATVYVRVEDQNHNQLGAFDTVEVTVSSLTTGDSETLTLWETGKSTGLFEGSIGLEDDAVAMPSDGLVQVQPGEQIEAVHTDFLGLTQTSASAQISEISIELVDAAGVPSDVVVESDWAHVRLESPYDNLDPFAAETVTVNVTTLYFGDDETLWLTETGADTGVFVGSVRLAGPWTGSGPGFLDTANSGAPEYLPEVITALYTFGSTTVSAVARTASSRVELVDGFGQAVSTYPEGALARARVFDVNRNDPGLIDSFIVVFEASGGDSEGVTVTETGFDTSVYVGSVPLGPGSSPDDGELDAASGDTITLLHANYNDPGVVTATAVITGSATWFIDGAGQIASSYMESSQAVVRVADDLANSNPGEIETTTVDLSTELSGDSETLTLTETGPDTGVFEGTIPLSLAPTSPANGVLETTQAAGPPHQWETLYASHMDVLGQTSQATATTFGSRTEFLDPFGNPVSTYATGATAYVRVEDQNHNQLGAFDTVEVTVSSLTTGDSETLTLWETGKSTGLFEGSVGLEDDAVAMPSDGLVQAQPGEQIEAVHTDFLGLTQTSASAQISEISIELVDAAGVPSDVVVESDWVHVRLVSPYDNLDPFAAETVTVNVTTLYFGDDETLWLTETGADTGVFEGSVRLAGPWTGSGPGVLDTANSGAPEYLPELITAFYTFGSTTVSAVARTASSRVELVDGFGQAVSTYPEGALARARVFDVNRNDPGQIDSFIVVFEASGGDSEGVTVTETGFDTSVFVGSVPLGPGSSPDDGELDATSGDTITLLHANYNDPGVVTATAVITGSATWFIDGAGQIASSYMESSQAVVRVADDLANSNPGEIETTTVDLSTELSGDSETLTLTETGPDTGVFEGTIPLSLAPTSPANGVLETTQAAGPPHQWETLYASHMDVLGQTSQATATTFGSRTEFLDPFGNPVSTYATGATAYVRVEDQNHNQLGTFDTVDVTVSSLTTGDSETLTLWETGKSTGIFEGSIGLEDDDVAEPSDGLVQVQPGEQVEAVHTDFLGLTQTSATAQISEISIELVDAAGVPSDVVVESDWAHVRLESLYDNLDPFAAETVTVNVTTLYFGDDETLWLTETGADTGVFVGSVRLAGPWTGSGPGFLDTANSGAPEYLPEVITALYTFGSTTVSAVARTASSRVELVDGFGQAVSTYPEGALARARVFDVNRNDPGLIDSFIVVFEASGGDSEGVTVTETGFDTGVFVGSVPLGPGSGLDDGQLDAASGDTITLLHANYNDPGVVTATAAITGSATWFIDGAGQVASSYMESSEATVRVADDLANSDPGVVETTTVALSTELSGDSETLTLTETGPDTGVFEGTIPLSLAPASPANGVLETTQAAGPPHQWETLYASHMDALSQTSQATATTFGSRTEFLDAFGNPISSYATGATVYVRVEDQNFNQLGVFDMVEVTVSSLSTADSESLTLSETSADSGLFEGFVELADDAGAVPSDGLLQAQPGEEIEAAHVDFLGLTQSTARAAVAASQIAFVDASGAPTSEVLEAGTARVRLVSLYDNLDPGAAESVPVNVTTFYFGDDETLWLTETGADTHVFEGSIQLAGPWSPTGPGILDTANSGAPEYLPERLTAFYGAAAAEAVTVGSRVDFLDLVGQPSESYALGSTLRIRVEDHNRNDPGLVDTVTVVVDAPETGDVEDLVLAELGQDSGLFEGLLPSTGAATLSQDGILSTQDAETLVVSHGNYTSPTVTTDEAVVDGGNAVPTALDDAAQTGPQTAVVVAVLANDTDPELETLTVISFTQGAGGTVVANGDGTLTYTPDAGFTGIDTFTYVIADPQGGQAQATVTVDVNGVPTVAITAPADGATFNAGDDVGFAGTASDLEDGDLTAALEWTSDLDGALGSGGAFSTSSLSAGAHTITAEARDSKDASGQDSVTVTINVAPSVTITTPTDGSVFQEGDTVVFMGSATDPEDGDLSASLTWESDLDGVLPVTGDYFFTSALSAGTHVVTAWVTDSRGARGEASITITINASPSVAITAPADATVVENGDTVDFTGTAGDPEEGDLSAGLAWSSDLDGPFGTGASLSTAALSLGQHTITASVTDGAGGSASASITLTVNDPPTIAINAPLSGSTFDEGESVELVGAAGDTEDGILDDSIAWSSDLDGALGTGFVINVSTLSVGVHTITASVADSLGSTAEATITLTVNGVPDVTITAPADGTTADAGDEVSFTGTASDAEDGDLTASIAWSSDLDGALGTGGTVSTSSLSAGVHTITAQATDSGSATGSSSITVTVNALPSVTITAPADGSVHTAGDDVTFTGTATDAEDGDLATSLAWTSSLDGALGTGASVSISTLSAGVHTITASVTDSHGAPGSATISVTINVAPSVAITAPADGSSSTETDPVTFTGTASDSEDGDLTASISWSSSLDGALGTGGSVTTSALSVGLHTIRAQVVDSYNAVASQVILVSVSANVTPNVVIVNPGDGSIRAEGDSVGFTGTANDNEDGDLTADLAWTSSLDGALGTGGAFSLATLSRGVHTITASVTDSHGATGTDVHTLTINGLPTVTITSPPTSSSATETDPVTFTATATDPDDGDISASIDWSSSLDGALGTGASVTTSTLSVGVHVIRAQVTDSLGAAASDVITFSVNVNVAPGVTITAPPNGTVVTFGSGVGFSGTASDPEDGELTAGLAWTSSLDGPIGGGGSFTAAALSAGVHTITASVTDSHGAPGSDAIVVTINVAPVVAITAPADGSVAGTGDEVTFTGTATDAEDGDLGAALAWTSDLDGALGTGATFSTATLSAGTHTVTASVADSHGAGGAASVSVIVKVPVQVTLTSIAAEDGWVLESSETSGVGGSIAVTGNGPTGDHGIRGGDDKKDKQFKGFLSFDTSSIPDTAVLRSATVRLRRDTVNGTNPFATHGEPRLDVRTGGFGGDTALAESDFEAPATVPGSAVLSDAPFDLDWSEGTLDAPGLGALNLTGTTQVRLAFELDDDNDRDDDYMEYSSGDDPDPAKRPQLVVEYLD